MLYMRFVAITSRITEHRREIACDMIKEGRNFIFAFWHARQFFLIYIRRNDRIRVFISESKEGEYIARVTGYFGVDTIRGSTTRGGAKALVKAIKTLREGCLIGITPDGPKGPVLKVQRGLLMLAQKTGCPIIPLSCGARRKKIFNSWDRYQVPYPFNKIAVTYGEPIYVKEGDDLDRMEKLIEKRMNENTRLSDELAND